MSVIGTTVWFLSKQDPAKLVHVRIPQPWSCHASVGPPEHSSQTGGLLATEAFFRPAECLLRSLNISLEEAAILTATFLPETCVSC